MSLWDNIRKRRAAGKYVGPRQEMVDRLSSKKSYLKRKNFWRGKEATIMERTVTDKELDLVIQNSRLLHKYNQDLDRESAYEMLNEKIKQAEAEEAKQKAEAEKEALKKAESKRKTSTSRRRSNRQNPIVKVLSSPTVIRSVLGILTKMLN